MGELPEVVRPGDEDALALVDAQPLSADEAVYARAARAANTVRGYRSDWREWTAWCADQGSIELPADPAAISSYLTFLASHGAKVGTMSRRLSAIRASLTGYETCRTRPRRPGSSRCGKGSAGCTGRRRSRRHH